jgi:Protein of unknown function (DUF3606)
MRQALPDHELIDLRDPDCVRAWVDALDISPEELFRAVSAVGHSPRDVLRYATEEE